MNSYNNIKPVLKEPLIEIKRQCDNKHTHCREIALKYKNNIEIINQDYLKRYLNLLKSSSYYNSCLSNNSNNHLNDLKDFIVNSSISLEIPIWDTLVSSLNDETLFAIVKNQFKLDNNFINKIIDENVTMNYGNKIHLINSLISIHPIKILTFDYILTNMTIQQFNKYYQKMNKPLPSSIENSIIKFIELNTNKLKQEIEIDICIKMLNYYINNPKIVKTIYNTINSSTLSPQIKQEILNKSIGSFDKDLILSLLDNNNIIPDINTIINLVSKSYVKPSGSNNCKQVAEIIDILCEFGLIITKPIIIKLLETGCYINNIEKYNIDIDEEILVKCANLSYYPYKFTIIPTINVLKKECTKSDNLDTIKKLKEFGGIYNTECLVEACKIKKNGKIIKYLINECGIKANDECVKEFQLSYGIESLDIIIDNYSKSSLVENNQSNKIIELNKNCIMNVTPRDINIDKDNETIEYILKSKIKTFFDYKKKNIKYIEVYQLMLKYLIDNNLIIGNYFIIDEKISNLLKINHCTIMHLDQLHNILTYFIDPSNNC